MARFRIDKIRKERGQDYRRTIGSYRTEDEAIKAFADCYADKKSGKYFELIGPEGELIDTKKSVDKKAKKS